MIDVYFMHDRLTPGIVRAAWRNSPSVPRVGDAVLPDGFGYMGVDGEWLVTRVQFMNGGRSATVWVTDGIHSPAGQPDEVEVDRSSEVEQPSTASPANDRPSDRPIANPETALPLSDQSAPFNEGDDVLVRIGLADVSGTIVEVYRSATGYWHIVVDLDGIGRSSMLASDARLNPGGAA